MISACFQGAGAEFCRLGDERDKVGLPDPGLPGAHADEGPPDGAGPLSGSGPGRREVRGHPVWGGAICRGT